MSSKLPTVFFNKTKKNATELRRTQKCKKDIKNFSSYYKKRKKNPPVTPDLGNCYQACLEDSDSSTLRSTLTLYRLF